MHLFWHSLNLQNNQLTSIQGLTVFKFLRVRLRVRCSALELCFGSSPESCGGSIYFLNSLSMYCSAFSLSSHHCCIVVLLIECLRNVWLLCYPELLYLSVCLFVCVCTGLVFFDHMLLSFSIHMHVYRIV